MKIIAAEYRDKLSAFNELVLARFLHITMLELQLREKGLRTTCYWNR